MNGRNDKDDQEDEYRMGNDEKRKKLLA